MWPDRDSAHVGLAGLRTGRAPRVCPTPVTRLRLGDERGQAVTEFAMVVPLFAALVFVCVLFGKALYAYNELTQTANEAARLVAVDQPQGGSLCSYLSGEGALPNGVTLTISYPGAGQGVGEPVQVQASTSSSWVPIIGSGLGTLNASATMRIEQDDTTLSPGSCSG